MFLRKRFCSCFKLTLLGACFRARTLSVFWVFEGMFFSLFCLCSMWLKRNTPISILDAIVTQNFALSGGLAVLGGARSHAENARVSTLSSYVSKGRPAPQPLLGPPGISVRKPAHGPDPSCISSQNAAQCVYARGSLTPIGRTIRNRISGTFRYREADPNQVLTTFRHSGNLLAGIQLHSAS